jgi:hypothetical protein
MRVLRYLGLMGIVCLENILRVFESSKSLCFIVLLVAERLGFLWLGVCIQFW